jgi:hypothetical protein
MDVHLYPRLSLTRRLCILGKAALLAWLERPWVARLHRPSAEAGAGLRGSSPSCVPAVLTGM